MVYLGLVDCVAGWLALLDINLNGSPTSLFHSASLCYTFSILKSILFPFHLWHPSVCPCFPCFILHPYVSLVGCIYAPHKVNPNIFQFYFDFLDIFHHTSMHPFFRNFYEFYLIFNGFISPFIIYQNHLYLRQHFLCWFHLVPELVILSCASCPELKSGLCMRS